MVSVLTKRLAKFKSKTSLFNCNIYPNMCFCSLLFRNLPSIFKATDKTIQKLRRKNRLTILTNNEYWNKFQKIVF